MKHDGQPLLLSAFMTFFFATHPIPFDHNVLALYMNTAALCAARWCESKDRYWLVFMAFLHTEVVGIHHPLCADTFKNGTFLYYDSFLVQLLCCPKCLVLPLPY